MANITISALNSVGVLTGAEAIPMDNSTGTVKATVSAIAAYATANISGYSANLSIGGNAATATNVAYSGLTGTIPTWNQNTTGNASTATNVAYSGLTGTVPIWNQNTTGTAAALNSSQVDILFTPQTSAPTATRGAVWYDSTLDALAYNNSLGEVVLGEQVLQQYCYNNTGSAIPAGSAVYVNGQFGTSPSIALATAAAIATSNVIGLAVVAIPNGTYGYVINQGVLANLNTSGFTAGQTLYLSASTPGGLVNTIPGTQFYNYRVAICTVSSATIGQVFVNIATAYVLPSAIVSPITFTAQSTTYIPLQIYGYSSGQIADLLDVWTYSGGTKALSISNTGVVAIPSATTTTQAATDNTTKISSTAFANTAVSNAVATLPGCNVLINGDMSISQINGGTAVTPAASGYAIDMWNLNVSQPSKLTFQQVLTSLNSLGAPVALKFTTASAYTSGPTDAFETHQLIEGSNFDRFFYGSANAKVASLQFKANASISGTYSGAILNAAGTRSYVFTFALAAGVDTPVFITGIPGDGVAGAGQWIGPSPQKAAELTFDLGSGSSFRSSTINAWQAGIYVGATGATSLVANAGATLAISEVQFELGPVCTAYERKLSSQSLAECQKYLQFESYATNTIISVAQVATSSSAYGAYKISVPMRVNPTATVSGTLQMNNAAGATAGGSIAMYAIGPNTLQINGSGATGLVAGNAAMIETYSAVTITFDARL